MKRILAKQLYQNVREQLILYDDTHNFTCDICGLDVFANERVCEACNIALPWNSNAVCPYCGRKQAEEGVCLDCKQKRICLDMARSCFEYDGEVAKLILRFKRGEKYLFRTLTDFLMHKLDCFPRPDFVAYVPMTERAEKKRGYNQSRLLAEELSRQSKIELFSAIVKKRETQAQKSLDRSAREKNLKGCFHVTDRKSIKGKRVLIIDDVLTTGATAEELADCLYRADAKEVYLLTVASVTKKNAYGNPPKQPSFKERIRNLFAKLR